MLLFGVRLQIGVVNLDVAIYGNIFFTNPEYDGTWLSVDFLAIFPSNTVIVMRPRGEDAVKIPASCV